MPATTESLSREYCAEEVCDEGLHDQWSEDQRERFLPLHSGTVSRLVLNKESLQRSGPWHLFKFHILASEQVPRPQHAKLYGQTAQLHPHRNRRSVTRYPHVATAP